MDDLRTRERNAAYLSKEAKIIVKQAIRTHGKESEYRWFPYERLGKKHIASVAAGWKVALTPPLLYGVDLYVLFTRNDSQ